jgi:hypothetical protein
MLKFQICFVQKEVIGNDHANYMKIMKLTKLFDMWNRILGLRDHSCSNDSGNER